MQTPPLRN
eukprot:SM014995S01076  [mRNA]  locus=s14995:29:55:- [translate_table: standard]